MNLILSFMLANFINNSDKIVNSIVANDALSITRQGEILLPDITEKERKSVYFILDNCPSAKREYIDPFDVLTLLRLEKELAVPKKLKGLLPAIFCIESSLQKGFGLYGDKGLALGPGQLHMNPYLSCISSGKNKTGHKDFDYRNDFIFSARCWITNIKRISKKVEKTCSSSSNADKWRVSEAFVSNYGKYKHYGCNAQSKHFRLLNKWKQGGFK